MSVMRMKAIFAVVLMAAGVLASTLYMAPAFAAKPPVYTGLVEGVGAGGYDVVAYFTENKPVRGDAAITHEFNGATWRFSSVENRDKFAADPEKFAPQYGGYCAYALSKGGTAKGDPEAWTIHNGKLYLNYSKQVRSIWSKDISGNIAKGDKNWPHVLTN